jgi:uracil-DNA glycosylase family 4
MAKPKTYVPPYGDIETAKIAFVGDQPNRTDIQYRRPFQGSPGRILDECMNGAGINPADCYFTNAIKDIDHKHDFFIEFSRSGVMLTKPGEFYADLLFEELRRCSADVIVAMGKIPLYILTSRSEIFKWRGSLLTANALPGKTIIPVIHPWMAAQPRGNYLNKHLIQFDLRKAQRIIEEGKPNSERYIKIEPSYHECLDYLEKCISEGKKGMPIAYDIEIFNLEVSCISFSYADNSAISIPFINKHNGDYFTVEHESEVFLKIAEILESSDIVKVGQNLSFDVHFMLRKYGIKPQNLDDTMIAQQILLPDYNKGLDFITSIWTNHPYYKDDGKQWFKRGGAWRNLWHYNATDSIICAEAFPKQMKELIKTKNVKTYVRQKSLIHPLVYMQEHGIRCDVSGMTTERGKQLKRIEELQEELNQLAGHDLNPNSPKQLKDYFYGEKKQKPYTSGGKISVDELALKRLARKGFDEAKLIIQMRKIKKICANYLNPDKVDSDGRYRCSYNPVGTRYSRISSSKSIFGTGGNLQNWPHEMQKYLLPDLGYVFYSFDLSQAENRIVAYVGRIKEMIDAFESGTDVHSLTASLIFNCPYEKIREDEENGVLCSLGDGLRGKRFWGKKSNHGLNYGFGYKNFSLRYEIPERDGKFIVDKYYAAYPGLKNGFHAYVQSCLRKNRTIENLMGRRTLFLDAWGDALFKEAYSCIPQGSVGDIITEHGVGYIYYNQNQFTSVELLNQVHDSVGFQIPLSVPWIGHARILDAIKNSLEPVLKTPHGREFVIPADLTIGTSLYKGDGLELKAPSWPGDLETLAKKLEELYGKLLSKNNDR